MIGEAPPAPGFRLLGLGAPHRGSCPRAPSDGLSEGFLPMDPEKRGHLPMDSEQPLANAASTRKFGPDLIILILLIGCTAYALLQLA